MTVKVIGKRKSIGELSTKPVNIYKCPNIIPHVVQARSDSLASVYSGAGEARYGSVTVRGQVQFGLQYNYKQAALEIYVKQCCDLAPVDTKRNRSDP